MDAAPNSQIQASPPAIPAPKLPCPPVAALRLTIAAWPRSAQLGAAFILGVLATLLTVHAASYLRGRAEPSELVAAEHVAYRVDLNDARRAELLQLPGVGPSLASRIEEYRLNHGRFQTVEELRKVPGIGPTTLERLRPLVFVRPIEVAAIAVVAPAAAAPLAPAKGADKKVANIKASIDVNHATLKELQMLPGIGPKMSQRIVDERDKQPFATVNDLRRVPGIGPKTFEKIKPYVTVQSAEASNLRLTANAP